MLKQKGDKINSLGTTIIIVFFLFLFSSFPRSAKQTDNTSGFELKVLVLSDQSKAAVADAVQLPSLQKSCLSRLPNLFGENYRVFADNRKITHSILLLQKTRLSIKPMVFYRFYHHISSKDDEDLPILS